MLKKIVIAGLSLSLVMASMTGCDDKKDDSQKKENGNNSNVSKNVKKNVDDAKKAIKGELDFAYDASVKVTLDKSLTGDVEIKPAAFTVSTKQKGKTFGADFGVKYDDKAIATLNTVIDRNGKMAYAKIPELSDSYVSVKADDAKKKIEDLASSNAQLKQVIDAFDKIDPEAAGDVDFDTDKFAKSVEDYANTFKDKLPDGKDGDKLSGDIDGAKYDYKTTSYEVTGKQVSEAAKAVLEKAKTDDNFKKIYEQYTEQAKKASSSSDIPTYDKLIEEAIKEIGTGSDSDKAKIDIYFTDDDKFAGFKMSPDDKNDELTFITVDADDACGVDFNFKDSKDIMSFKGSVKTENDKANGEFNLSVTENGKEELNGKATLQDVVANDDEFKGTIRIEGTVDGKTGYGELTADSDKDNKKLTFDIGADSKSLVKVDFECKTTNASDVKVPSGKTYNALDDDELQEYVKEIQANSEKFMNNLKDALGDDLFSKFAGSSTGGSSNTTVSETDDSVE